MSQARGLRGTMTWAYGVPAHVTRGSPGPGGADRVVGAPSMARYLTGMATPFSALLAAALAATPLLARQQPAADPPGALPYEAAFDRRELLQSQPRSNPGRQPDRLRGETAPRRRQPERPVPPERHAERGGRQQGHDHRPGRGPDLRCLSRRLVLAPGVVAGWQRARVLL